VAILRFVLLSILVLVVLRLVRFAFAPPRRPVSRAAPTPPALPERLVQDPVCGLRLPEGRAVRDGDAFYCSEDCLRASRGR
jgi:hypothetical protein